MAVIGLADDSVLRDDPYEKVPSEDNPSEDNPTKDNPTDGCDWRSQCFHLVWRGVRLASCQTNLIGRAARLLFLVNATWLVRPIDCPVMDASDWPVWLNFPWRTLLIGPSDWLVLGERFWLARPIDLSLANAFDWSVRLTYSWRTFLIGCFADQLLFYGLLSHAMSDMQTRWRRKRICESVFFAKWEICNNTPFWPVFDV